MAVPLGTDENCKILVMIVRFEVLKAMTIKKIQGYHIIYYIQNKSSFQKNVLCPSPGYKKWK